MNLGQELAWERVRLLVQRAQEELELARSHHMDVANHYDRIADTKFYLKQALQELRENGK